MTTRKILILSSSLLTDRMLSFSSFSEFANDANISFEIWSTSIQEEERISEKIFKKPFPKVLPFKEFPYNFLRRLNDFAWDYRLKSPSRLSMMKWVRKYKVWISILKIPARMIAWLRLHILLEKWVEKKLLQYDRIPNLEKTLRDLNPDAILCMGPHRFEEPAVVAKAKKMKIPVLAFITSWDNLSTKNRMVFEYDGFFVWSPQMKKELLHFYPSAISKPISVVGAPQFDVFFQEKYIMSREEFCKKNKLDYTKKIVLYALGSPNFLQEYHGAIELSRRISNEELRDVLLLVRPHPLFDKAELQSTFQQFLPTDVVLQNTSNPRLALSKRSQNESQIYDWVNTFRHADIIVNLSSTVVVDGAIFDKPIVNLDFDPEPDKPNQRLVKDVNHRWTHFKTIAESGGVWLVNDTDELVAAIKTYLQTPYLHCEKRQWIAEYVCGFLDGKSGYRLGMALVKLFDKL